MPDAVVDDGCVDLSTGDRFLIPSRDQKYGSSVMEFSVAYISVVVVPAFAVFGEGAGDCITRCEMGERDDYKNCQR